MAGVLVSYCLLVHDWCTPDCHVAVAGCTENCGGIASYGCGGGGTYRGLQACSPTPDTRGLGSSAATFGLASSLLPRVKGEGAPTFDTGAYWSATAQVRHRNSPTGNAPPPQR